MRSRVHLSRKENAVRQSIRARMCIVVPSFDSYLIVVVITLGIVRRSTWLDRATRFWDIGRFRDGSNRIFFVLVTDAFGGWLWTIHDADSCRVSIYRHSCTRQANKH
jgi:hypothetical protein